MSQQERLLRFEKVSFAYRRDEPVLDEADFSLRRGLKVVLMGQNGAGKSTVFKLIVGELKADDGRVFLGDFDLTGLDDIVIEFDGVHDRYRGHFPAQPAVADIINRTESVSAFAHDDFFDP